jgi:UDP-N-acetylmuramate--alanine ligase
LAAVAVALELDIPFSKVAEGLDSFAGIHRRLEVKGEPKGILILDDYGHHPAEIQATLTAIRDCWSRPLTVIFQPHRYSRTRDLFDDFLTAFDGADCLILTEIYPAGEEPIPGIRGDTLYQAIRRRGHLDADFVPNRRDIVSRILPKLKPGDLVLTLGAGDIYKVGEELVEILQQ